MSRSIAASIAVPSGLGAFIGLLEKEHRRNPKGLGGAGLQSESGIANGEWSFGVQSFNSHPALVRDE
jgi:hypothetical protein